jgi:psiF repeat
MRLFSLLLGCVFAISLLNGGAVVAQIQGRGMTVNTPMPQPVETPQEKRQKSTACNGEAKNAKLTGKDRTAYLKYCNSSRYAADFKAPGVDEWRESLPPKP